ncbi:MAG: BatD family protein, partial [Bdellovibrionales bacterium]|nr:BatD family protein [Bdellovibrionales bacterium]
MNQKSLASIFLSVMGFAIFSMSAYSFAQSGGGKLEVKATLDRRAIEPSESVVLSVSVESTEEVEPQTPTLPPLNDFEVLNQWQAKEVRANLVQTPSGPQFQTMRRMVFNYQLSPKRLGALTIYPVEVVIDGRSYRTSALTLQVASGAGRRQAPNSAPGARPPP